MNRFSKEYLAKLYDTKEIKNIWSQGQSLALIEHPEFGLISPNQYRAKFNNKCCPFCAKRMVHGRSIHTTKIRQEAINRGYQFEDRDGNNTIIKMGVYYFHPHYVSLDHKTNKTRCPELMFDYNNLQIMCIRCNRKKGDDNTFDSNILFEIVSDLAEESLNRYKPFP